MGTLDMKTRSRIIGLTGGIGTGKSTVARSLEEQGLWITDADQLAREAIRPGSPLLQTVIDHFGAQILNQQGQLDRRSLGRLVFSNAEARRWLEQQIHPYVRDQMQRQIPQAPQDGPPLCLVVPLLFEADMVDLVTEIWVVWCSEHQQIQRLLQRDQLSRAEIEARIASQLPLSEKIKRADVVLDNSGSLAQLQEQIRQALESDQGLHL